MAWEREPLDPRVRIKFKVLSDDFLELHSFAVDNIDERGQGLGSAVLEQVNEIADEQRVDVLLYPDPENSRLARFYSRFGYQDYGYPGSMIRRRSRFYRP